MVGVLGWAYWHNPRDCATAGLGTACQAGQSGCKNRLRNQQRARHRGGHPVNSGPVRSLRPFGTAAP